MSTDYNALANQAERGVLTVKPGTVRRGPDSRAESQRLLMAATDASTVEEVARVAVGRPRLGSPGGQSPMVRARVPQSL